MTPPRRVLATALALLSLAALSSAGCGGSASDSPTSPTPTDTTPTAADPAISERFTGTLAVSGAGFYAFEVTQYGTVELTVQNVGGVTGVPDTVWVGIGVGVPEGTGCTTSTSSNVQAGAGPHVTSVLEAGIYCARIYDIGNLAAPTPFAVLIAHP